MTRAIVAAAAVVVAFALPACSPSWAPEALPDESGLEYARWETLEPGEYASYNPREILVQRGREVYDKYCVGCHGDYGDGRGPAAERLITPPRDFRRGIYKFRSTDSGSLPMETDLYRTITRGLSGVSMPGFPLMPHRDKLAVIEYLKTFYPHWERDRGDRVIVHVPRAPGDLGDDARIARGRIVYVDMQCGQCHGIDGRGTGATRTLYEDAWGNEQKPYDFTRGSLKGGDSPRDIYRTFHTGLRSIMPSYGGSTLANVTRETFDTKASSLAPGETDTLRAHLEAFPSSPADVAALSGSATAELAERNSWDLVAYIESLRTPTTTARAVLGTED